MELNRMFCDVQPRILNARVKPIALVCTPVAVLPSLASVASVFVTKAVTALMVVALRTAVLVASTSTLPASGASPVRVSWLSRTAAFASLCTRLVAISPPAASEEPGVPLAKGWYHLSLSTAELASSSLVIKAVMLAASWAMTWILPPVAFKIA